jgi:hypothetical protein
VCRFRFVLTLFNQLGIEERIKFMILIIIVVTFVLFVVAGVVHSGIRSRRCGRGGGNKGFCV